jgi:methionine-rich copper-binding protein CopC
MFIVILFVTLFFTIDVWAAPTVTAVSPEENDIAPVNIIVSVTFSEDMDPSTINESTFSVQEPFALGGYVPIEGQRDYGNKIATFTPETNLEADREYRVILTIGIKNTGGTPLEATYEWHFTTEMESVGPLVSTSPPHNAINVSVGTVITATFSTDMDPSTILADHTTFGDPFTDNNTFYLTTVTDGETVPIPGTASYSDKVATFTPDANLETDTVYSASITTSIKDAAGNKLPSGYKWYFTTAVADIVPPEISSSEPADNAENIATNAVITVTFSEGMKDSTIDGNTFKLMNASGDAVAGTVTYADNTATFAPAEALAYEVTYTAQITTGVTDLAGNALQAEKTWSFTTAPKPDTTPPAIISVSPAANAENIAINTAISAAFSEDMKDSSIDGNTFKVSNGSADIAGTVTYADKTATFTPAASLSYEIVYTVKITTGVTDPAGNALQAEKIWSFTTASEPDTTPPAVTSTNPADTETEVPLTATVTAVFSEEMKSSTLSTSTFKINDGSKDIAGSVTYENKTATFIPTQNLGYDITYTATVITGVTDLAGNALQADKVWSFTTISQPDIIPPAVNSVFPADTAENIPINSCITAVFSEEVKGATVNSNSFKLSNGTAAIPGSVTYTDKTATFTPDQNLDHDTDYTVTITTAIADLSGNLMQAEKIWSFTTSADAVVPSVVSVNPPDGTQAPANTLSVTATFSEEMDSETINADSFLVKNESGDVAGQVTYNGLTAVFTPEVIPSTSSAGNYTATITSAVTDLAGNALESVYEWGFTIGEESDTTPPQIISVSPENSTVAPVSTKIIRAVFSEAMYPPSITFLINTETGGTLTGEATCDGATATFALTDILAPDTTYTAIIKGATDLAGNPLQTEKTWSFTTNSMTCGEKGDINGDGSIDLYDALIGLQTCAGISMDDVCTQADTNSDGKIGMEEVIYILQMVAM